ncbi:MAG: hypothetical protein JXA25_19875 [Anaerolineales bacterium]|nr:hypothetical protein [Anaerolineales bacterium]
MDSIKALLKRMPWIPAVAALITGIVFGLLIGWVIAPVEYVDATPAFLRQDLRDDYLRMAIDSYSVNKDVELAVQRYEALSDYARETLSNVSSNPQLVSVTAIQNFRAVVEIFQTSESSGGTAEGEQASGDSAAGVEPTDGQFQKIAGIIPYVCGATALIGLMLAVVLIIRARRGKGEKEEEYFDDEFDHPFEAEDLNARLNSKPSMLREPLAEFRTIYTLGDDLYDDSFSIESPNGDFLGECGVGIGDVLGVGEPKKVSGFEVWLFDKNDIQTVTKVILSEYGSRDEATLTRLAAKGDPVMAEDGGVVELQTASLRVEARIVELIYGEGALPHNSFFERVTIELRAWPRATLG